MKKIRLHQFLSKTGLFKSKKDLLEAVKNSEIKIVDKIITSPNYQFRPKKKNIYYKNRLLMPVKEKVYILMNKPEGYLSSGLTNEWVKLGKKSIFEIIKGMDEKVKKTLFCVGRLDEDTSGLIIITNDGKLGIKIASPKNEIKKAYVAVLSKSVAKEDIKKIEEGVTIKLEIKGKYKTKKCSAKRIDNKTVRMIITEGKKREIKRIFETLRNKVIKLKRTTIGRIKLEELNLKKGEYKFVDKAFIEERI